VRRFELLIAFVSLVAVAWPAVFGVRPRRGIISVTLLGSVIAHVQFEGLRWQMIPLYAVALGLAVGDVVYVERTIGWTNRLARGIFGVGGVLLAASLAVVLPVPELPAPAGPEAIGTVTVQLSDPERLESYGSRPGGQREFMAQVWYPAERDASIEPQTWAEDWEVVAPAIAERLGFPSWFLSHTRYTNSNARESLLPLEGNFPIVIYSHGWTGFRSIAINQIESLASSGYIVIAPDHTYGAVATRLEDGEVIPYDPSALPDEESVTPVEYEEAARELIETFAGDITTILNELEQGARGVFAFITDNADLSTVGVYGHSTGGGAAVKVCLEDDRCDAALGMDPWVEPLPDEVLRISAAKPAMFMRSDGWRGTENDAVLRGIAARSENVSYWIGIDGAEQNDFVVAPLFSPIAGQMGLKGPIPAGRVIPIVDNYLVGFFDVFLLGTGSAALDAITFDEVTVELITPSG
jgi:hypothetical protein